MVCNDLMPMIRPGMYIAPLPTHLLGLHQRGACVMISENDENRDDELDRLIASESTIRRGRGAKDREERQKEQKLQRDILRAMQHKDERKFSEMLRTYGMKDGDENWIRAWKAYRVYWGQL
jgi:hypothetical protein